MPAPPDAMLANQRLEQDISVIQQLITRAKQHGQKQTGMSGSGVKRPFCPSGRWETLRADFFFFMFFLIEQ
jgi:hypothetical protein